MSSNPTVLGMMNSASLNELNGELAALLRDDTITGENAAQVEGVVRGAIRRPAAVLEDLLGWAFSSPRHMEALGASFDEKEFWVRIFLTQAANYSIRLHVWLPSPPDGVAVETAHNHRRYLVSYLLNNLYTAYEYRRTPDNSVELSARREIPGGTCYLIGPETIHAVSNQTDRHTVSLIVRGNSVKNEIHFFNQDTMRLAEYVTQRPIGRLGKTEEEQGMDRQTYLSYRLGRLASECRQAA